MSNCTLYKPFIHPLHLLHQQRPFLPPFSSSVHLSVFINSNDGTHTAHPVSCLIHIVKIFLHVYGLFMGWEETESLSLECLSLTSFSTPNQSSRRFRLLCFSPFFFLLDHAIYYVTDWRRIVAACISKNMTFSNTHYYGRVVMCVWLRQPTPRLSFFFSFGCLGVF